MADNECCHAMFVVANLLVTMEVKISWCSHWSRTPKTKLHQIWNECKANIAINHCPFLSRVSVHSAILFYHFSASVCPSNGQTDIRAYDIYTTHQ